MVAYPIMKVKRTAVKIYFSNKIKLQYFQLCIISHEQDFAYKDSY